MIPGTLPMGSRSMALGAVAGLASGLLGIGGGVVAVPLIVFALGESQRRAHATSLAAMIPIAGSALVAYGAAGETDWARAGGLAIGAVAGAKLGADFLASSRESTLKIAFGVALIAVAVTLIGAR